MSQEDVEDQCSTGNNLAWFVTGVMIGATVAMLYTPKSGKQTRQFLADTAQKGKDAVTDTSASIVEAGKDMFDRGRQLVDDAADLFERGRKLVKG